MSEEVGMDIVMTITITMNGTKTGTSIAATETEFAKR